ncbi:MFS transporter [Sinomonas cyclohexanicum]|uniref:MFS transporter n=1 Tax=Sinomonas cyclohexanicum TaxID=322009 RepID=A0ABN6FKV9_SINCY|nr:MFS transporter [Corynebacterium cyclohexanicum]BCT77321.1 MFS transporter [Corynebacterium cyclohexanicum]
MVRSGNERFSLLSIAVPAFGPSVLFSIGEGAILPVVPLSARDLGGSVAVAALTVTLIGLGSLVFNLPASLLTVRFGERWAIVGAQAAGAVALAVSALATELWQFMPALVVLGMAASVTNLARQKYLTEAVPPAFRARALSTLGGTLRIGLFLGPFLGAGAMQLWGLRGAYWVGAAVFAGAAAVALFMPDLEDDAAGQGRAPQPRLARVAATHWRVLATVGLGVLFVSAVRQSRQVVIPLWAEHLGLDAPTASLVYGIAGGVDLLLFYPGGKLMDVRGRLAVAVPSMTIMGLALVAMPFTAAFWPFLAVSCLLGLGNGIGSGMIMTLGADFSPDHGRAQFLGLWRLMADSGSTLGPVLLSAVTAASALGVGVGAAGLLGLAAAGVLAWSVPRAQAVPGPAASGGSGASRRSGASRGMAPRGGSDQP